MTKNTASKKKKKKKIPGLDNLTQSNRCIGVYFIYSCLIVQSEILIKWIPDDKMWLLDREIGQIN